MNHLTGRLSCLSLLASVLPAAAVHASPQQTVLDGDGVVGPHLAERIDGPVALFAKPSLGCAPLAVKFTSEVEGGPISAYFWEFGEGSTSTQATPTFTYTEAGLYSPKLTVTLPNGAVATTATNLVTVNDFALGFHADFTANPTSGAAPLTVDFAGLVPPGTTAVQWSFGDQTTSGNLNPSHTYTTPGIYDVGVVVTGGPGESDTRIKQALVEVTALGSTIDFNVANADAELGTVYTRGNTHTGGCAWVDYNGDLLPDLFVTNGFTLDHFLFRNEGDGTFEDVSHLVPKPSLGLEDAGVKFADIENDGDTDILVTVDNPFPLNPFLPQLPNGGPNLLYVNQGDGTFAEGALAAGVVDPLGRRNIAAGFADYDLDGFVDLYLAHWTLVDSQLGVNDDFDRLLHNNGDGTFADVTAATGVDGGGLDALCVLWFDADMDLYPDLYVGNVAYTYCPPFFDNRDRFYQNNAGVFSDAGPSSPGVGDDAWAAMGLDVGDIDNDGDWDLYVTDIVDSHNAPLINALYRGNPDGTFADNSADVSLVQADRSWPCNFADFDRNGWVDLWVGSGDPLQQDFMFVNRGDGTFSAAELAAFEGHEAKGGSIADYDGDGDVDIFVWGYDQVSELLRNDSTDTHRWLEVKLMGVTSNADAIGAVARVTAGGMTQMRRVTGGDSAHSQSDLIMHFGVGDETTLDLDIQWPSGIQQSFPGVAVGQLVVINEIGGLLDEQLTEGSFSYDPLQRLLHVSARSNYGGRTALSVEGLGELRYSAARTRFEATFEVLERPASVSVRSERGATWKLPEAR